MNLDAEIAAVPDVVRRRGLEGLVEVPAGHGMLAGVPGAFVELVVLQVVILWTADGHTHIFVW